MIYSHHARSEILKRLDADWQSLADMLEIPAHKQRRFRAGYEPRAIWDWLEARKGLSRLPDDLATIGRPVILIAVVGALVVGVVVLTKALGWRHWLELQRQCDQAVPGGLPPGQAGDRRGTSE